MGLEWLVGFALGWIVAGRTIAIVGVALGGIIGAAIGTTTKTETQALLESYNG